MDATIQKILKLMKGGLVVSVQQPADSPLNHPEIIAAMAEVVAVPGVVGLRINGPENVAAVKRRVHLPVIGIYKVYDSAGRVWITPTYEHAAALSDAGADIIAVDATADAGRIGQLFAEVAESVHEHHSAAVMADVSTLQEGIQAASQGADLVASTLSGYTRPPTAQPQDPPDLALVKELSACVPVPVIAEGRYNTPALASQAIAAGAHAVVVGSMITRPDMIARAFAQAVQSTGGK